MKASTRHSVDCSLIYLHSLDSTMPLSISSVLQHRHRNRTSILRRKLSACLAALCLTVLANKDASAFNFVATDSGPVPELTFLDADGNERSLEDFQGRVIVLNLWATWCAPCRKEMPSLDRLQASHGGDDFEVIALAVDRGDLSKVLDFYGEIGIENLAIYHDPTAKAGRVLRAPGLPTTLIIDRNGEEIGRVLGDAEWDSDEVAALVDAAIAD
jgi:thiol-disulfide isomerase/thioredoxin